MSVPTFPTELILFYEQLSREYQRKAFSVDGTYTYSEKRDEDIFKIFAFTSKIVYTFLTALEQSLPNVKSIGAIGLTEEQSKEYEDEIMLLTIQALAHNQAKLVVEINRQLEELRKVGLFGGEAGEKFSAWIAQLLVLGLTEEVLPKLEETLQPLKDIVGQVGKLGMERQQKKL